LVGLCEVENDSVLHDLTRRSALHAQGYDFIITNSPDERGIDIALLYQRHQFKILEHTEYEIKFSDKRSPPTRNILHAVGTLINKDTLDVFVSHFPSRVSGKHETEQIRIESAQVLRNKVDSILTIRAKSNLVIMGDFNDEPLDKSLLNTLKAKQVKKEIGNNDLYNLFYTKSKTPEFGTYKYQGIWSVSDHLIVNGTLLNSANTTHVKNSEAYIYNEKFLLEKDEKYYGMKPFRTNIGPRYNGGFSDHLPIYMDLIILLHE
jgi:endonuclease/exonuclease/phosphatase family metal-dependent hydrolase